MRTMKHGQAMKVTLRVNLRKQVEQEPAGGGFRAACVLTIPLPAAGKLRRSNFHCSGLTGWRRNRYAFSLQSFDVKRHRFSDELLHFLS